MHKVLRAWRLDPALTRRPGKHRAIVRGGIAAHDMAPRRVRFHGRGVHPDSRAPYQPVFGKQRQNPAEHPVVDLKALRSLVNHREGLCVFVDRPQVPLDNNLAERVLRGPAIGRRLSFGSGVTP